MPGADPPAFAGPTLRGKTHAAPNFKDPKMKNVKTLILASTVLAASLMHGEAKADSKYYSVGGCAPYTTGTPNYSQLRIRPESVQNQGNGYLYVICPIVRDAESSWGTTGDEAGASVSAYFRTNTAGNFQCTLNVGSNRTTLWTDTKSVSGDPGDLLSVNWSTAETQVISALNSPASLVCRLPPKGSIVAYAVHENGHTDDGVYP
jgi:hypothetical protein